MWHTHYLMKSTVDIILSIQPFQSGRYSHTRQRDLRSRDKITCTLFWMLREGGRGAYIVDVGGPHFHCKWIHSNPLKGEVRGKPCLVHETLKFCIQTKFQDWEFLGENFRKRKVSSRLIWLFAIPCEETLGIFAISEKD